MSLVAYASSSGDESENDDDIKPPIPKATESNQITDGDFALNTDKTTTQSHATTRKTLILPVPKLKKCDDTIMQLFEKLPVPKASHGNKTELIEEEDDEFLYKKAIPSETPAPLVKNLVRITIPSLKDFDDVEERKTRDATNTSVKPSSFSSLINILPQPKSEQNFAKAKPLKTSPENKELIQKKNLIPDTVKNRRPAQSTENVDRKLLKKPPPKPKLKASLVDVSDSDGSDNEGADFFSLKSDDNLPEVSADEIAAMVSKKAAEMAKVSSNFKSIIESKESEKEQVENVLSSTEINSQPQLDEQAIQALMGSQGKRRKLDEVNIIDISSDQVLPNKDDWLRTALASATTYQATGVLTDDEPVAGTRRKHQITYLAHKAKANEAELQAMWSANRQNRRQTQSKYGF